MTRVALVLLVAACSGAPTPAPPAPANTAPAAAAAPLVLPPTASLGSLALAPAAPGSTADDWLPVATAAVVAPGASVPAGTSVTAIGRGAPVRLTAGAATKIGYGCDGNQLDVLPFTGAHVDPGVVWLLPAAATWTPTALAITASRSSAAATYTIGPIVVALARTKPMEGTLLISRGDTNVLATHFTKSQMDGAPNTPADLAADDPGVPRPVAAWELAPRGPILLVLLQPGYEGVTLQPVLVEAAGTRDLADMTLYLYRCAF